jgi:streptogramin lyase
MKHALSAAVVAAAVLVAACSGGGGSSKVTTMPAAPLPTGSGVPAAGPVTGTRGTISLLIPATTAGASAGRRAQFVSPASASAVVSLNGGAAASYDVSSGSTLCSPAAGGRSCTLAVGVPFGTTSASVAISLYNGAAGLGTLLGSGTGSTTIPANATSFSVAVDVSPIVASVAFSLAFPSTGLPRISLAHVETGTATLIFTDPGGAVISSTSTSTFVTPITVSVVDPSGTVSISPTTPLTNASQPMTVTYTGGATLGASVTFNAFRGTTQVGTLTSKTSGFQTNFPLGLNAASQSKNPDEITVGSDGFLWFTEFNNASIGRMNPADGTFTEFLVPVSGSSPNPLAIAAGPVGDPHVWYTEPFVGGSGGLGDFSNVSVPSGTAPGSAFFTGNANSGPVGIRAAGNNIWMSLQNSNQLMVVDTSGTQVPSGPGTPPPGTEPNGIAVGPDGNVWVTGFGNGTLLAFSPTAPYPIVATVSVPSSTGSAPAELVTGSDNALWFTEQIGNGTTTYIGRMPVGGPVTEFALPAPFAQPWAITNGSDGGIWFTSGSTPSGHGEIVRIDPTTHAFVGYPMTTTTQGSVGLVTGSDGNLWATDFIGSAIVRTQP